MLNVHMFEMFKKKKPSLKYLFLQTLLFNSINRKKLKLKKNIILDLQSKFSMFSDNVLYLRIFLTCHASLLEKVKSRISLK